MTKHLSLFAGAALAAATLAVAPSARATMEFPGLIQTDLQLTYTPQCSLCHPNNVTGPGTAQQPFAESMKAAGLAPYDDASLNAALLALQSAMTDSDGDGVSDIDELLAGTDPNGAGAILVPTYGCGARIAPTSDGADGVAAFVTAALLALSARRKKRRR
ncbi:MAG TPA: thrombospondin type 3 repeat-containing protein [Byssovorax sp.]